MVYVKSPILPYREGTSGKTGGCLFCLFLGRGSVGDVSFGIGLFPRYNNPVGSANSPE